MRCEDYPCCGHAGDPGGCPDFSRRVTCEDCGRTFYPDALSEEFCYRCQESARIKRMDPDARDAWYVWGDMD